MMPKLKMLLILCLAAFPALASEPRVSDQNAIRSAERPIELLGDAYPRKPVDDYGHWKNWQFTAALRIDEYGVPRASTIDGTFSVPPLAMNLYRGLLEEKLRLEYEIVELLTCSALLTIAGGSTETTAFAAADGCGTLADVEAEATRMRYFIFALEFYLEHQLKFFSDGGRRMNAIHFLTALTHHADEAALYARDASITCAPAGGKQRVKVAVEILTAQRDACE